MAVKAVLFDLDGTLIDSSEGIIKSVLHALNHYGIEEHDVDGLRKFIGPPLWESFAKYYDFPKDKAVEAVQVFRERYNVKGLFECSLYPGVRECLEELSNKGYRIGIASSKPEETCKRILDYHGVLGYFDNVSGASMDGKVETKEQVLEQLFSRWPDVDKDQMVLVGDTLFDVQGANSFSLRCIAVSFGFGSAEEMVKEGAVAICDDMAELPGIIKDI